MISPSKSPTHESMKTLRTLRIACLIIGIFGAGIATGRYSMPAQAAPASGPAQFSSSSGRVITPRLVMLYFDQKLNLTPGQKQRLLGEAQKFVREINGTEPATPERFDIFHRYYPRVRALLNTDQYSAFDTLVKDHEAKMATLLKEAQTDAAAPVRP